MRQVVRIALVLVVLGIAASASAAPAGSPTRWDIVSVGDEPAPVAEIGHTRTRDGVLHVGWVRRTGGNNYDLMRTKIQRNGRLGTPQVAIQGWYGLGSVALTNNGTQVSAIFPATRVVSGGDPCQGMNWADERPSGQWENYACAHTFRDQLAHGFTPAAVRVSDGVLVGFTGRDGIGVYKAPTPGGGTYYSGYRPRGSTLCCNYNVELATNPARNRVYIAWCSAINAPEGIWAQQVNPANGAPLGSPMLMPGTGGRSCPTARVPLMGTANGFWIAALSGDARSVLVWRIGSGRSDRITRNPAGFRRVGGGASPDGRIWVAWSNQLGADKIHLKRSNRAGVIFGPTVHRGAPRNVVDVNVIDLNAQNDRVDILGIYSAVLGANLFHAQAFPALTLQATGGRTLRFRVLDAGDPVAGATIAVGGRSLTTGADGRASVDLRPGRFRATASKPGYVGAAARVRSR